MRPIQRRNRDQVEIGKQQVEPYPPKHHALQHHKHAPAHSRPCADHANPGGQHPEHHHQNQVRCDPRQRYDDIATSVLPVIPGVHRYWLGTAEEKPPTRAEPQHGRQQNAHPRIDVFEGIHGQPSERLGRTIPLTKGRVPVGILVRHHGNDQHREHQEKFD